jgi:7,8-dihydro-6-hydroxymethylpterin dimethyltransferase
MRKTRPYTYLGTVQGMCRQCRALVPCRLIAAAGAVYQERLCPTCGPSRALIAESVEWYMARARTAVQCKPYRLPGGAVRQGCPHDCGPCALHANACHLPVFSITNACNMACPICFTYNRPDRAYHMSREELKRLLDNVIQRVGPLDLINITGGEPTLHPQLFSLLEECRRPEIGRVTVNSNGLRLAEDAGLCEQLARLGIYVILSFDTFNPERSRLIHGRDVVATKLAALENLQRFGAGTTLMNVMIRGVNEDEIGRIVELAKAHSVVRSITVQTMTFTGQGGKDFGPRRHMPLDAAEKAIEIATGGEMLTGHFVPHARAHPLCYSVAYYLRGGDRYRSFTDFLSREQLGRMLQGYLLRSDGEDGSEFREAIDRLWAEDADAELLARLKSLVSSLYPSGKALSAFERQRLAEEQILTVYIHSHMDEDTLDTGRLMVCPDQVPDPDGRMIPACAYNLFYRMQDERFYVGS